MPSSSDRQRELMTKWFGDIDSYGPEKLLKSHGFVLRPDWYWEKPTEAHEMSQIEHECMLYLIEEWDYGGWVNKGDEQ